MSEGFHSLAFYYEKVMHMKRIVIITQDEEFSAVMTGHIKLNPEQKIGTCELCNKRRVIVTASGYHVAFVCNKCI